ncbi:MAG: DUF362 domain-containing protein [Desulfobacterota bacterium]|nr:DUF362 domain-containing protein [Thermodesulfobacteriota bacterium]
MDRRRFLKLTAAAAAVAMNPLHRGAQASQVPGTSRRLLPGPGTRVCLAGVAKGSPEQAIRTAVRSAAEAATDFSWLAKGDTVFIKPVVNSGKPYPATTSPIAVAAMIELLKEKGALRVVVGDMSGIESVRFTADSLSGSSRKLMESSGLARAVLASGGETHFFEEPGWHSFYEDVPADGTNWKRGIMMPKVLQEVQHIVLMPRCARHVLAGSTLGLKAAVGYWRHDTRLEYHRDAATLQEKTAEANTVGTLRTKQRLVLSAADKVLTTFGPDDGYVHEPETGLVMASESVVAHDMVSLAWLLENRRFIPEAQKNDFLDTSTVVPRVVNHVVAGWLGGMGPAFSSEKLTKNELNAIWDDRVITRACEVFGGVPGVLLEASNNAVSADLKRRLTEMTALPA